MTEVYFTDGSHITVEENIDELINITSKSYDGYSNFRRVFQVWNYGVSESYITKETLINIKYIKYFTPHGEEKTQQ